MSYLIKALKIPNNLPRSYKSINIKINRKYCSPQSNEALIASLKKKLEEKQLEIQKILSDQEQQRILKLNRIQKQKRVFWIAVVSLFLILNVVMVPSLKNAAKDVSIFVSIPGKIAGRWVDENGHTLTIRTDGTITFTREDGSEYKSRAVAFGKESNSTTFKLIVRNDKEFLIQDKENSDTLEVNDKIYSKVKDSQ
eukprot:TRINITY_DN9164_c0_g1_i1.p1 TRINITY_DN9164_c0_g1~~TRINITY_DN9164_c0_g1_i1.p1  ORF type:complete len:196 (+),score=29.58 TRINITY_DN9164_c0_g1_i1:3-590(+)